MVNSVSRLGQIPAPYPELFADFSGKKML